ARWLVAVVGVTLVNGARAAPTPAQRCAAGKAQGTGKALAGLLKGKSTGCKKGTAGDAACQAKGDGKVDAPLRKLGGKGKGSCAGTDNAPTALARLSTVDTSLLGDLSVGGPSKCTAAKYLATAKLSGLLAKCRKSEVVPL